MSSPAHQQSYNELEYQNDFLTKKSIVYQKAVEEQRSALIVSHSRSSDLANNLKKWYISENQASGACAAQLHESTKRHEKSTLDSPDNQIVQELSNKINHLDNQLLLKDKCIQELENFLASEQDTKKEFKLENERIKLIKIDLENEVEKYTSLNKSLNKKLQNAEKDLNIYMEKFKQSEANNQLITQKHRDLEISLQKKTDALDEKLYESKNSHLETNSIQKQLRKENEQLSKENEELIKTSEDLSKENDILSQEIENLIKKSKQTVQNPDELTKENYILNQEIDNLVKESKQTMKNNEELSKENDVLTQEIDSLVTKGNQTMQNYEDISKENDTLTQEIEKLVKSGKQSMQNYEELAKENNSLTQEIESLVKKGNQTVQNYEELSKENDNLNQEMENLVKKGKQTMENYEELSKENDTLNQEINSLVKKGKQTTKTSEELSKANDILTQEINTLVKKGKQTTKTSEELSKANDILTQEIENLIKKDKQTTKTIEELQKANNPLTQEIENLYKKGKMQIGTQDHTTETKAATFGAEIETQTESNDPKSGSDKLSDILLLEVESLNIKNSELNNTLNESKNKFTKKKKEFDTQSLNLSKLFRSMKNDLKNLECSHLMNKHFLEDLPNEKNYLIKIDHLWRSTMQRLTMYHKHDLDTKKHLDTENQKEHNEVLNELPDKFEVDSPQKVNKSTDRYRDSSKPKLGLPPQRSSKDGKLSTSFDVDLQLRSKSPNDNKPEDIWANNNRYFKKKNLRDSKDSDNSVDKNEKLRNTGSDQKVFMKKESVISDTPKKLYNDLQSNRNQSSTGKNCLQESSKHNLNFSPSLAKSPSISRKSYQIGRDPGSSNKKTSRSVSRSIKTSHNFRRSRRTDDDDNDDQFGDQFGKNIDTGARYQKSNKKLNTNNRNSSNQRSGNQETSRHEQQKRSTQSRYNNTAEFCFNNNTDLLNMITSNVSLENDIKRELYPSSSDFKNDLDDMDKKLLGNTLKMDNCDLNLSTNKFSSTKGDLDVYQSFEKCPITYESNCVINTTNSEEKEPICSTRKSHSAIKRQNVLSSCESIELSPKGKKCNKNNLNSEFDNVAKEELSLHDIEVNKRVLTNNESMDTRDLLKQSVKKKTLEILQKINNENNNNNLSNYLIDGDFETWNIRKSQTKLKNDTSQITSQSQEELPFINMSKVECVNMVDQSAMDNSLHKLLIEQSKEFIKSRKIPKLSPRELVNSSLQQWKALVEETTKNQNRDFDLSEQKNKDQNITDELKINLIENLRKDLEVSSVRQRNLENIIQNMENNAETKLFEENQKLNLEVESYKTGNDELEKTMFDMRFEIKKMETELHELKNHKIDDLSLNTYGNISYNDLEKEVGNMRREKVKLEDDILQLRGELSNLEDDRESIEVEREEVRKELEELQKLSEEISKNILEFNDEKHKFKHRSSLEDVNEININEMQSNSQSKAEIEYIQTGTFGEESEKKINYSSSQNKVFEERLYNTKNQTQEQLNYDQQDLLIKYMKSKITELERVVSLQVKSYKISSWEMKTFIEKAANLNINIDPLQNMYSKSINVSMLSKEPLSNDKFLSDIYNSQYTKTIENPDINDRYNFNTAYSGYSPMMEEQSEVTIPIEITPDETICDRKPNTTSITKTNNISNISFAIDDTELTYNLCNNKYEENDYAQKINDLQNENEVYKDKITELNHQVFTLKNEVESQQSKSIHDESASKNGFDAKMDHIKSYMKNMSEKILDLLKGYENFQQDVVKTSEILSFSIQSKKDNISLCDGIQLQKDLLCIKEDDSFKKCYEDCRMAKKFESSFNDFVYKSFYNNSVKLNEKTDKIVKCLETQKETLNIVRKNMKQNGYFD